MKTLNKLLMLVRGCSAVHPLKHFFFDQGGAETFSAHIGVPIIKADA